MDMYIRVALLVTGIAILMGIAWDIWRRKKLLNLASTTGYNSKTGDYVGSRYNNDFDLEFNSNVDFSANQNFDKEQISENQLYSGIPMANRQLETIISDDPHIVKVNPNGMHHNMRDMRDMRDISDMYADSDNIADSNNISDSGSIDSVGVNVADGVQRELVISLSVIARMQRGFPGYKLLKAFESANLVYGKMNIFHRYANSMSAISNDRNGIMPLFSVSSAVEPGFFNIEDLALEFVPGITLFTCVSDNVDANAAFELLVRTAKQLSFTLNGELLDHNHKPLTVQTIERYRNMVANYNVEYA